ncbi:MAG: mechanosensitive ion channel family protein [Myxococcaceae bacterium]
MTVARAVLLPTVLATTLLGAPAFASADGGIEAKLDAPVREAESLMGQAGADLRSSLSHEWRAHSLLGLERWQWLAVPLLIVALVLLTLLFTRVTRLLGARLSTTRPSASHVIGQLEQPLRLWWASLLARITLPLLQLSPAVEQSWQRLFTVTFGLAFFWGAIRAVSAWSEHFLGSPYAYDHPGSRSLVSLFGRVARFALVAFAVLATLSEFGYSVTSVLAGLGIGGIALALGAQKTLENVFGAFALAVDQPIREGDLVRIGELMGTVESIGLRSTRIRTVERTVVSIPNGKLADLQLETFAARDRIRFTQTLSLALGTTTKQLDEVMKGFRAKLEAQPKLFSGSVAVHLVAVTTTSLDVDVAAWFATTDYAEFRALRETVLLEFLSVLEASGAKLATPVLPAPPK